MKRLRLVVLLIHSYIKTHWQLFLVGLAASLAILFFAPKFFFQEKIETIGLVGDYTLATLPIEIQNEISIGLTTIMPDGKIASGAASSWEFSDGNKSVTFNLVSSRIWQDGLPFTPDSVNYNLKSVTLTKPAPDKIKLSLLEPFAPLLSIVSQPLFKNGLIGLGTWRADSVRFTGRFVSSITLVNQDTKVKKTYKFFSSETDLGIALKLGAVNQARGLHDKQNFESDPHYALTETTSQKTVAAIFFNLQNQNLDNKTFRQGLSYALPNTFPQGEPATGPFPPTSWAHGKLLKKYPQSVSLAKKFLHPDASASSELKLTLQATANLENAAKIVAQNWGEAGVETSIQIVDVPDPAFEAFLTYVELPPDPDQYFLWHTTQPGNISHYKSPKVDKLLEDGRKTINQTERKDIYDNFEKAITEDLPAIFLFYPKLYNIARL